MSHLALNSQFAGKRVHCVGVGGAGMSALALLLKAAGAEVSGCDRERSAAVERLRRLGLPVSIGHDPAHVGGVDMVVHSSAIPGDHPELLAATGEVVRRGTLLARLLGASRAVGICGSHGKTTTTAIISHLLVSAGRDPTCILGGMVPSLGGNLRLGAKELLVAELDESDGSFLEPDLALGVITNIDDDHLSFYGGFHKLREAFTRFAQGLTGQGILVAGVDSPPVRALARTLTGEVVTFGLDATAQVSACDRKPVGAGQEFTLLLDGREDARILLPLPGRHNLLNALAAIAAALRLGVRPEQLPAALAACPAVERRLQQVQVVKGVPVLRDYAHHPTEIACALQAVRELVSGPVLAIFQPHLYSRTRDCHEQLGAALARADMVVVLDIYPAREAPIAGIDAGLVATAARRAGAGDVRGPMPLSLAGACARQLLGKCGCVLLLGAGSIGDLRL